MSLRNLSQRWLTGCHWRLWCWLLAIGLTLGPGVKPAVAQELEFNTALNESVLMIPKKGTPDVELETTLYKPDGAGPFPVAIINHGKLLGDPKKQQRYRPAIAARFFLQRGYAVLAPMRQGFSNSTGTYPGAGCNVERDGVQQAQDMKAVLDFVATRSWLDKEQVVMVGQSHGGWTTLAFGALNYPGVKALMNFAGGLRQERCPGWEQRLGKAAAAYARTTRIPSLWFYGENDGFFGKPIYNQMYENYVAAGGPARLVEIGTFGKDAHYFFGTKAGAAIWHPEAEAFLRVNGLPADVLEPYEKYGINYLTPLPPPSGFAPQDDEQMVPFLNDAGREGYKKYLQRNPPKAFAIARNGAWGWASGGDDPLKKAIQNCSINAWGACRLYSVDDAVVWKSP